MARLKVTVGTDKVGSLVTGYVEIPDEEIEYLKEEDFEEMALERMWEMIDFEYEIEE